MKNKLFLFLFCMMFSMTSFCQNSLQNQSSNVERDSRTLEQRVVGTFEIVKISNKKMLIMSKENLLDIENRRLDTVDVFYDINPEVRIRILPRSIINAPDFIPIKN